MKKNYTRWMDEGIVTVGELAKELKKKFDPEDQVAVFVMNVVKKGGIIEPEKNYSDISVHVFTNTLQTLADKRKEKVDGKI